MRARFSQFKAVQARYVQLKALTGTDSKPMVFTFDGEYSVVADPAGGSVDCVVNTVIRNVTVGLGIVESWDARNARFDIAWVRLLCLFC